MSFICHFWTSSFTWMDLFNIKRRLFKHHLYTVPIGSVVPFFLRVEDMFFIPVNFSIALFTPLYVSPVII